MLDRVRIGTRQAANIASLCKYLQRIDFLLLVQMLLWAAPQSGASARQNSAHSYPARRKIFLTLLNCFRILVRSVKGGFMVGWRCRRPVTFLAVCLWLVAAFGLQVHLVHAQESPSFRLERISLAATAARASSNLFDLELTFAEQSPSGSVSTCNNGFFQSAGFWSVLGNRPVPIYLSVNQVAGSPEEVDLSWSGSADSFDVYRSENRDDVLDPIHLEQSLTACFTSDAPPVGPEVFYYLVVEAGN